MNNIEIMMYTKEAENSIDTILNRLQELTTIISLTNGNVDWYLPGDSKEDAMKKKVISNGMLTTEAKQLLTEHVKEDFPGVIVRIWNERDDSILIQNYIQGNLDLYVYTIEYQYVSEHEAMNFSSKVMIKLIDSINPHIVQLETNDYSLHQSKVFPDRLPVGWMFYIDKSYDEKTLNLPKQMHSIKREGQPVGTLFVTKRDFFDGSSKADITLSNDLEIALVAHDILPTYKKIF
ncbi:hypothetical protein FOT62_08360 [Serratia marcescens]|uniref:Uncharacterized protein n=1 Tax=Serratia marcescens TaxID=615 RepID=A0A5C7CQS3_SERMA|nr:Imm52 family immunity protein [Serratia marcescens]TXE36968.1 hypothetical protein FOT62_08360 [Serratia marcescens]TXE61375.1 hypothetical protein FOT56_18650 [Serratia marcescens]